MKEREQGREERPRRAGTSGTEDGTGAHSEDARTGEEERSPRSARHQGTPEPDRPAPGRQGGEAGRPSQAEGERE